MQANALARYFDGSAVDDEGNAAILLSSEWRSPAQGKGDDDEGSSTRRHVIRAHDGRAQSIQ